MPNILIIDDEPSNRLLLTYTAPDPDTIFVEVGSAKEARFHLSREQFDFAVVDLELPDEHGFTIVELLRQEMPSCKILITTASDSPDAIENACQKGALAYIIKPFDITTVKNIFAELAAHQTGMILVGNRMTKNIITCD